MLTVEMSSQTQQVAVTLVVISTSTSEVLYVLAGENGDLELSVIIDVMLSAHSDISQRVVLTAELCKSPSHDFCLEDPELKNRVVVDVNVYDSLAGFGIDQCTSDS
jgi:uncharacterized protein YwlG (UPF0340 family)